MEQQQIRMIDLKEVRRMVGLSRSTIYDQIMKGGFSAPVKIGHVSRWVESEVQAHLKRLIEARDGKVAA